jgi:hypothetical protein
MLASCFEFLEQRVLFAVDQLQYHNDLSSSGVNPLEVQLTPSNVTVSSFGKQFAVDVNDVPNNTGIPSSVLPAGTDYTSASGQVYAQPLVKTGVNITTGANQGVHDVVFVATMMNSLYAIDANGGTILWKDSFVYKSTGNPNPLNANIPSGVTPVPGGYGTETNSQDIMPWIGILATPVIDAANGFIYFTAKTREARNNPNQPHYLYTLHKVRLSDGFDTSAVIADTQFDGNGGFVYTSGPYVVGTGAGAITVNGQSRVYFNAVREMGRPGLTLRNGVIYTSWASHGDNNPYHGWVMTFDANSLATTGAFCTTPNNPQSDNGGGIWQGGGITAIDPQGYMYVETGNGTFDGDFTTKNGVTTYTGIDANGFPVSGDYGDSVLKLALDPTSTQGNQGTNKNGWGIKIVDYFTPYNQDLLDSSDRDLGSAGPTILPDSVGSAAHPHLMLASGKEGKIYLIDRDNMGKYHNTDNVVQTVGAAINGALDTASFFNGRIYYTSAYGGTGTSWQISNGVINTAGGVQNTPDQFGFPGATASISANGTLNGLVWMIDKGTNQLRAYDANNLANEIWTSAQNASRDSAGVTVKFAVPTVLNGRVYIGTSGKLISYGPPLPATSAPNAPTNLAAAATGVTTIQLNWNDNATNEDGYKIERSSDGVNFTEVGSAGVNATGYLDSGLSSQAKYYYRVRAYNSFNGLSYSAYSNIANATTQAQSVQLPVDLYHFDEGAGASTADSAGTKNGSLAGGTPPTWVAGRVGSNALSFSGSGAFNVTNQSSVDLTSDLSSVLGGTSSLAFWIKTSQVGSSTFYQAPAITGAEQSGGGNDIGWGTIDNTGKIGIFVGDTGWLKSTGAINNGQWHHVAITRNATSGAVQIYIDGVLNASTTLGTGAKSSAFKSIGQLSIDAQDGTTRTGGNYFNGQLDEVRVYNQVITSSEVTSLALAPAAPTNLVVKAASGTELDLTWLDNATTETGYKLERSDNGGPFVQIALLGPNAASYNDVGLTQGTPYSYRLRATNTAGDSGYSNTVNTTTPVPPITPTDAAPTLVTTTQVNLQWSDNSSNEDGFKIPRRTGENNFAEIANLPPNSTTFVDTNKGLGLTPGETYDYHIQAYNIAGYSDFTGTTVTTLLSDPAPTAPSNLDASAGSSSTINLSWTDNSSNEIGFKIERSTDGLTFTQIGTTGTNVNTFHDTGLSFATQYWYQVRASGAGGDSGYTNIASATTVAPAATTYLSDLPFAATPTNGWGPVELDTSNGEDNAGDGGTMMLNGDTYAKGLGAHALSDIKFNLGGAYTNFTSDIGIDDEVTNAAATVIFQVFGDGVMLYQSPVMRATSATQTANVSVAGVQQLELVVTDAGDGNAYDHADWAGAILTNTGPTAPAAPSNLGATATSTTAINLTWADNSANETGFKIERSTDGVTFTPLMTVGAGITSYSDTGLTASTTYSYRVRATNSVGDSGYSNIASATTLALPQPPAAPSGLGASATSSSAISLSWTDNSNNETGFKIERSPDGLNFTPLFTTGAGVTSYSDTALTSSTLYYYRVSATNSVGDSGYTNIAQATTQAVVNAPAAPSSLGASATSSSAISLTWTDNSNNETGFKIERSTDGVTFTQITVTAADVATFSDTGLIAATRYYYRIRATNSGGDSSYTSIVNATTLGVPNAPSNLALAIVASNSLKLTWADNSNNETGFKVERSTDGTNFSLVTTLASNTTTFTDTGLASATKYYYRVRAAGANGDSAPSSVANLTTLPLSFVQTEVGTVGPAGSVSYNAGTWTLKGSGTTIGGTTDSFHFVYETLSGDGTIICRLTAIQNTNSAAQEGIMIRETLAANSKFALVDGVAANNLDFVRRTTTGASSSTTTTPGTDQPDWIKLVRSGNNFSAYKSTNGTTWTQIGSTVAITMATQVYIGLAVCSHNNSVINTSTLDNLQITGSVQALTQTAAKTTTSLFSTGAAIGSVGSDVLL